MGRRFLTAEDVRRLGGPAIAVDADTVVTPQALEAAASLGIQIQSAGAGSYSPPTPDRGPDAERALKTLSHLPEPGGAGSGDDRGVIVTVIGKNRSGVLAEITAHLAAADCNIHKVSQEIVEGYFHLILTVELGPGASFDSVKTDLEALGGPEDFVARAMHQRVFRFMHRI
mgnify:CR=1 FL=1